MIEYEIELGTCTHCKRETMSQEERMTELREKLVDYKEKTKLKKERRAKWENWKKT